MESVDVCVLRDLHAWLAAGHSALLATVVRTWGSSPRPVGSMLALRDDGRLSGSVSGGCIEDDLISRYGHTDGRSALQDGQVQSVTYGVSADEAHRFGLPCGGTLQLLLEFNPDLTILAKLLAALDQGELVTRTLSRSDGSVQLQRATVPAELIFDDVRLVTTLGPGYRMLLIGAGSLAQYLATMAIFNGFDVTLCDPRREYVEAWQVPGVRVITDMPDDAVIDFNPDQRSCVIALSHDPKLDDLALLEAIHSKAFYVGAIGSRRNSAGRRERLATYFSASEDSLRRLRGPIGIYIGSKTPSEIAVSVMAEVLAVKNGVLLSSSMEVDKAKNLLQSA
ncbi:XdhC family protein [Herbaspirillum sp. NPDC087042]|uniref:XdhC family protein n=1 Tax=Herbaspirillum sp. NPDC087042 TaxID=3364004 RepID=UPI003822E789